MKCGILKTTGTNAFTIKFNTLTKHQYQRTAIKEGNLDLHFDEVMPLCELKVS